MRRIFAIGGGDIGRGETLDIDRKIVAAAGKEKPNLLFIPTASGEPFAYVHKIEKTFGDQLGCTVETLYLLEYRTPYRRIKNLIEWADIIYVGGGNTKKMMITWAKQGVDDLLIEAWARGTVMSGLSAGAICWFLQGQSDSDTYESGKKRPYIYVTGMGMIPMFHCPHHDEADRAPAFDRMVRDIGLPGLALENGAAMEVSDERFRIHTSLPGAKAYLVKPMGKNIGRIVLPIDDELRPLNDLLWEY